ncbi:hypothetical protein ACFFLM_20660 [Deinococcus oregonensis]|uniref:Uncharacterized protein n=1 Tax=Deinococcus oregonensis TaxID=1805970 RepID=A0ABV6B3P3_9DEIO
MPLTLAALRRSLHEMDAAELRSVIETLFQASTANKNLLAALLDNDTSELRAKAEAEIGRAFSLGRRRPTLKTSGARAAIAAYAKVAAPLEVLTLQLQFVRAGLDCWNVSGGPDTLLDSLASMWNSALKQAGGLPPETRPWAQLEAVNALLREYGMGGLAALDAGLDEDGSGS